MYSGFLNVNKPTGITSHDVVNQVRRLLRPIDRNIKVGHAGTLDPLADGVLIMCIGDATRLSDYVMHADKGYQVVAHLGQTTDTYDAEGPVTSEHSIDHITPQDIVRLLPRFTGEIMQVPPAYSAIKQGGKKLYELARAGDPVVPEPRRVTIHELELIDYTSPYALLNVICGPGTYIRSIVHDLGKALGVGAHVLSLTRTFSGDFKLRDSVNLEEIHEAAGMVPLLVRPVDALTRYVSVIVTAQQQSELRQGRAIAYRDAGTGTVMVYDERQRLVAIGEIVDGNLKPRKVFADGAFS